MHEFIVICRAVEIEAIENELYQHQTSIPIRLIPEDSILQPQVIRKTKGWYIQQLLKLGVARCIYTESYLVLDSDCFLTKPFAYENLFNHNKFIMNANSWKVHTNWWIESAKILGVPMSRVRISPVMGVSPQILITPYVCQLLDELNRRKNNLAWDEYLCTQKFTEFTLYWLFLIKIGSTHRYQPKQNPALLGNGLWRSTFLKTFPLMFHLLPSRLKKSKTNDFVEKHINDTFKTNDDYFFSLVQSNIKQISVECVAQCIKKYV